jgi:N-acetylneuraminate synthase/N,N'-diacetyllegionaminate synthase
MAFLDEPPIVIAEIGNNHGGSLDLAKQMVLAALEAGTPYVKFQTMIPERLLSRDHPAFEEFSREALSFDAFRELHRFCAEHGAVFLSTPFDRDSADFLEELGVPAFKISSGDLTYIPFLVHVARKHEPILLSTGCSTREEIDRAVETIRRETQAELILMHCTAAYPCPDEEANLRVIPSLAQRYGCRVGFSDHTLGIEIALAASALGAVVIEKHFTINRSLLGGDNEMSIQPEEIGRLVTGVRRISVALGAGDRRLTNSEAPRCIRMRRSLVPRRDMTAGEVVRAEDVDAVRPGGGLEPSSLNVVVGKTLARGLARGERFRPDILRG